MAVTVIMLMGQELTHNMVRIIMSLEGDEWLWLHGWLCFKLQRISMKSDPLLYYLVSAKKHLMYLDSIITNANDPLAVRFTSAH